MKSSGNSCHEISLRHYCLFAADSLKLFPLVPLMVIYPFWYATPSTKICFAIFGVFSFNFEEFPNCRHKTALPACSPYLYYKIKYRDPKTVEQIKPTSIKNRTEFKTKQKKDLKMSVFSCQTLRGVYTVPAVFEYLTGLKFKTRGIKLIILNIYSHGKN